MSALVSGRRVANLLRRWADRIDGPARIEVPGAGDVVVTFKGVPLAVITPGMIRETRRPACEAVTR